MKYAIGVDIGGTNTRVAIINGNMEIVEKVAFETDAMNPNMNTKKIIESIHRLSKDKAIEGIGISCPGPLDLIEGKILDAPNLPGWFGYEIVKEFETKTGLKTRLENDANVAALAEAIIGKGKLCNIVHYLTISTGIGSGLVINKKVYQGAHGFANEIANMILWRNGPQHGELQNGAVEAIASGSAITKRAKDKGLDIIHAGEVHDLALKGNETAKEIMEDAYEYLANAIGVIIAIEDPDVVVLSGTVALKIEGFVEEIQRRVKGKVFKTVADKINIVKSELDGDSGLIGAGYIGLS